MPKNAMKENVKNFVLNGHTSYDITKNISKRYVFVKNRVYTNTRFDVGKHNML